MLLLAQRAMMTFSLKELCPDILVGFALQKSVHIYIIGDL